MWAGELPLLQTKIAVPLPRAHTIARHQLLALMPSAPGTRLALLSAPAGFGKTTTLAAWCHARAAQGAAVAWVTLDAGDNDQARFLAYLYAAVARAVGARDGVRAAMDAAWPADRTAALIQLINALAGFDRDVVLVLDDYHLVGAPAIHSALAFLLDHLPERVCIAIGSRVDPPLPLARLRASDLLVELRAAQLRFSPAEVQLVVQSVCNRPLAADEVQAIFGYAEGWPAAVQLAAFALRAEAWSRAAEVGEAPMDRALECLDASQHYVFAYLADDVFARQPPHLKTFLLQTAILDRMCGPLCDAVLLGARDEGLRASEAVALPNPKLLAASPSSYSQLILDQIERANLFLVPLDRERRWFRYHYLFHAFLRAQLACEPRARLAELHRRASAWFERNQLPADAVRHTLAAGDMAHATELIARAPAGMALHGQRGEYRARLRDTRQTGARGEAAQDSKVWPAPPSVFLVASEPVETLSERELEVLQLIAGGASNQTIATALVISLGTVKSHINHILGKLAASNRTEAVARARNLGLLAA
jgi:LuxR family maltose regulon positive regulatory protein